MAKGILVVVSAPSGAGKSTLIDRIRSLFPEMIYSISCTTRPPRQGETDGVHYFFVEKEKFQTMIDAGGFLEWKEVHGNLYGTPAGPVLEVLNNGGLMVLDVDVQGAAEVFRKFPDAVSIFICAPNERVLEERLRSRGTDSEKAISIRLENARREMEKASLFRYRVVNDELDRAVKEMAEIIRRERSAD